MQRGQLTEEEMFGNDGSPEAFTTVHVMCQILKTHILAIVHGTPRQHGQVGWL